MVSIGGKAEIVLAKVRGRFLLDMGVLVGHSALGQRWQALARSGN